jgi:outer membrane protein OmpA-like peptidoglycan-associated protein
MYKYAVKAMSQIAVVILLCLFTFQHISANEGPKHKFGIFGGINYNFHTADFNKLKDIPNCCPNFQSGSDIGYNVGILYEFNLENSIWFGARLGMYTLDGIMIDEENTTIIVNSENVNGTFEHTMEGYFTNIGFEPYVMYEVFDNFFASVGFRAGTNIKYDFYQIETITDPPNTGTFVDENGDDSGMRTRNEFDGEIPEAISFQIAALARASYELPMNSKRSLVLAPELSYHFPITEYVKDTDWKVHPLSMSVAVKYIPKPKQPKEQIYETETDFDTIRIEKDVIAGDTFRKGQPITNTKTIETDDQIITQEFITRIDTIYTKKEYALAAEIGAVGIDESGKEIPNPVFKVEEYVSNRLDPLLNYIFFDENSSNIPNRYDQLNKAETAKFNIDNLYRESTLEIYYNLLNIIGKRMQEFPDAELIITGCNADIAVEKDNLELSKSRAEAIKQYLVENWNIDDTRIQTEARGLPAQPSTPTDNPVKIEENRRAELSSDDYRILEPVFIEKIDRSANPPIVRFKLNSESEARVKKWQITAYQEDSPNDKFIKEGTGEIPKNIDWQLESYQKITPKHEQKINYEIKITDTKGNETIAKGETPPVEVTTLREKQRDMIGDYEIERFSLILFGFDEAKIEANHKQIIDFIKTRLKPDSEVEILGYTDRTGESDYNQKLSENRAKAAKNALNVKDAFVNGVGEDDLLYTNELPEGRFYCRTVQIIVKTKVK